MALGVAFQAFFKALFDRDAADRIRQALVSDAGQPKLAEKPKEQAAKKPAATKNKGILCR